MIASKRAALRASMHTLQNLQRCLSQCHRGQRRYARREVVIGHLLRRASLLVVFSRQFVVCRVHAPKDVQTKRLASDTSNIPIHKTDTSFLCEIRGSPLTTAHTNRIPRPTLRPKHALKHIETQKRYGIAAKKKAYVSIRPDRASTSTFFSARAAFTVARGSSTTAGVLLLPSSMAPSPAGEVTVPGGAWRRMERRKISKKSVAAGPSRADFSLNDSTNLRAA